MVVSKRVPERMKEFLLSDKGRKIMIAAALAIMLLLLLSTVSCDEGSKSSDNARNSNYTYQTEDFSKLERELEQRLEALISQIEGAGKVSVMVTIDTSSRRVYDRDEKTESKLQSGSDSVSENYGRQTEVVLAGSSKEPLEIMTVQPQVRGAAVVCSGASDPVIKERVANAVAKALNIGISRVYVTC